MLRRHSSKSKPAIRHRKSTSSVRSVHLDHIDTECARRDAHTAATEAYARGRHRSSVEAPLFPTPVPPRLRQLNRTSEGLTHSWSQPAHLDETGSPSGLRRRQSVRFVVIPPERARKTERTTDSDRLGEQERDHSVHNDQQEVDLGFICGETKPPPSALSPHEQRLSETYIANGPVACDHYDTPVDDPSSYHKIHRSQSMIAHGSLIRPFRSRVRPESLAASTGGKDGELPPSGDPGRALRAPKSLSFLGSRRIGSRNESDGSVPQDQDGFARDEMCLGTLQISRPHSPSSGLGRSISQRLTGQRQRPLRMSLRDSVELPLTASMGTIPTPRSVGIKGKARKASENIKSRFKTLFGRRKKSIEHNETDSRDEHGTDDHRPSSASCESGVSTSADRMGSQENDMPFSIGTASRVASIQIVPVDGLPRSHRGSLESARGDSDVPDDGSRVTSWASSGLSTVASQQQAWSDLHRQRLSVIKENGFGVPSAADGTRTPTAATVANGPKCGIDSQRVYSALAKRLTERQQLAREAQVLGQSSESFDDGIADTDISGTRLTAYTIRRVPGSPDTAHNDAEWSSALSSSGNTVLGSRRRQSSEDNVFDAAPPPAVDARESHAAESPGRGQPRPDRSSVFFGSPTYHLFRTASPYRRAIRESMKTADSTRSATVAGRQHRNNALAGSSATGVEDEAQDADEQWAYSESSYSCAEEEYERGEGDDSGSLRVSRRNSRTPGAAESSSSALETQERRRAISSEGSVDWKTWLSANVSKLEVQASPAWSEWHGSRNNPWSTPTSREAPEKGRHMRESAQIYADDDEDTGVGKDGKTQVGFGRPAQGEEEARQEAQPLTVVQPNMTRKASCQQSVRTMSRGASGALAENKAPRTDVVEDESARQVGEQDEKPQSSGPDGQRQSPSSPRPGRGVRLGDCGKAELCPQTPERRPGVCRRAAESEARARPLHRTRTTEGGSPYQQQGTWSVRLVRRAGSGREVDRSALGENTPTTRAENGAGAGQQTMDQILSSRRRRMASSEDGGNAFV
ncbi:hypothetical protein GGTG_08270 [Gaeumannomyces tritici R3-111a-1]|uniref:Uncharacterized protein n=1 Tax=Gaeumannomyces tritici (strain R3-111a-1) TaxID=644352 RepID=J3P433_GAET3|nr:hypothetical protein GGTG_08270 [Gaeumannomyces tritici R3-111a-1]EJT74429.1 hypothetical protein GGTG_08270 [Gaeumannomyces tritici R3-111a-1]